MTWLALSLYEHSLSVRRNLAALPAPIRLTIEEKPAWDAMAQLRARVDESREM